MPSHPPAVRRILFLQVLGADIAQLHLGAVGQAAVDQGLVQALVRFGEVDIFAGDGDGYPVFGIFDVVNQILPGLDVRFAGPDVEELENLDPGLLYRVGAAVRKGNGGRCR